jgi:hypothetical protein
MTERRNFQPRKPDYYIKIKLREKPEHGSERSGRVGVGYKGENGSIAITLDPGVVLDWRLCQEATIILAPPKEAE